MEIWLGELERTIKYDKWYFGHFHGNKNMGKYEMLFEKIKSIDIFEEEKVMEGKEFYTTNEIAEYFQVSPATIRNWIKKDMIIGNKLNNGRYLISYASLQKFLRDNYHYANNK